MTVDAWIKAHDKVGLSMKFSLKGQPVLDDAFIVYAELFKYGKLEFLICFYDYYISEPERGVFIIKFDEYKSKASEMTLFGENGKYIFRPNGDLDRYKNYIDHTKMLKSEYNEDYKTIKKNILKTIKTETIPAWYPSGE